jgi:hypothetical protein
VTDDAKGATYDELDLPAWEDIAIPIPSGLEPADPDSMKLDRESEERLRARLDDIDRHTVLNEWWLR